MCCHSEHERLSASDRHFYVPSSQIDGKEHKVPHFCQWIKFCHLLREGSRARIAVKVLMNYMDTIARRVSLNRDIVCVANIVTMFSISDMIYTWKNHFYEMKGNVGMSVNEKERKKEDAKAPRCFLCAART